MTKDDVYGEPYRAIEARLLEIVPELPTRPDWFDAWNALRPHATPAQFIPVVCRIRHDRIVPDEAGLFLVLRACAAEAGPMDSFAVPRVLAEAGEPELVRRYERDSKELELACQAGREYWLNPLPGYVTDPPEWTRRLALRMADALSAQGPPSGFTALWSCRDLASFWTVNVRVDPDPATVSTLGFGFINGLHLDLSRLQNLLEPLDGFGWRSPRPSPDERAYVWLKGNYHGREVLLRIVGATSGPIPISSGQADELTNAALATRRKEAQLELTNLSPVACGLLEQIVERIDELASVSSVHRARAARALYKGPGPLSRLLGLVHALRDPAPRVQSAAAETLIRLGRRAAPVVPYLIHALRHCNVKSARGVGMALGTAAAGSRPKIQKCAVEALLATTHDERLARYAVWGLALMGSAAQPAVPRLCELLMESRIRSSAARALGCIGPAARDAVPSLLLATRRRSLGLRYEAILSLGRIGPAAEAAVPRLHEVMAECASTPYPPLAVEPMQVRLEAAIATWKIVKHPEAIRVLATELLHERHTVRLMALIGLRDIGRSAADTVPQLALSLKDERALLRVAAAQALTRMGPAAEAVIPDLIELLNDSNSAVRMAGIHALARVARRNQASADALLRLSAPAATKEAVAAAIALWRLGRRPQALSTLTAALERGNDSVRLHAIKALARLGSQAAPAVPSLLRLQLLGSPKALRLLAGKAVSRITKETLHAN